MTLLKFFAETQIQYDIKSVNRYKSGLTISNDSDHNKHIVFIKPFFANNQKICVESKILQTKGNPCSIKLLSRNLKTSHVVKSNHKVYIDENKKIYFIAISIPPNSEYIIKNLSLEIANDEQRSVNNFFKGDALLITPGYPDDYNKYNCAFVHTRMKAYKELGWKIDLAVVNEDSKGAEYYNFEGIDAARISHNDLRTMLQTKKYPKILIHFFNEKYAQILDATDLSETKVYLYCHGADTMYWDYGKIARRYFNPEEKISDKLRNTFLEKDGVIKRYNEKPNVKWVFVTDFTKDNTEKLLNIKFNNSCVIPCLVDEKKFYFTKRKPDARKKICIIRKFDDISSYSIDIDIRIILELSKRKSFKDMDFSVYGDGCMHEALTAPVKNFPNVHIYKKFLSHQEMAEMFNQHGIALFATRYDSQAVASCEAAMTGAVVITSKGVGVTQFIDPKMGTYCETEDIKEYADLIENLYDDEKTFLKLGPKMRQSVINTCGYNQTISKDIELLKSDRETKLISLKYKPQLQTPVLTVAVPSYNVERFLKNSIHSLINHPQAHKIEVLIIDDGSKDNTSKIGSELEKLTKTTNGSIVRLITKQNGGHGSAINTGIKAARGKYFRLMDGDDYFDTDGFVDFIEILEKETSDIVLTNYVEDFAISAIKHPVRHYDFMEPGIIYDLENMVHEGYGFHKWGPLLSTTTCKTEILKNAKFKIDEHCFYVDMEYNFIIYALAKNVVYYPLDLYVYYLGRQGQSMSMESFKRNCPHHEKVCIRLLEELRKRKNSISESKQYYLVNKIIIPMCKTQYQITTEYFNNNKNFLSFDKKLKEYPDYYNNKEIAGRIIKLHRITGGRFIFADGMIKRLSARIKR